MPNPPELEELIAQLEKAYNLEIMEVTPVRRIYKLVTGAGIKGLKKLHLPLGRLKFMAQAMNYLGQQGFKGISPIFYTCQQQPFFQIRDNTYYLVDWVEGRECDFLNYEDLQGALEVLAHFHLCSQGFSPTGEAKSKKAWGKWTNNFKKILLRLEAYKSAIKAKTTKTPFDREFLAWVDYFTDQGNRALAILANSQYLALCAEGKKTPSLCHHDVSARNFICAAKGQEFLIDFEYVRYDIRVYDLGRFISRALFDLNAGFEKAREIINIYRQVSPLKEGEYPLLLALAYFPQKFWRLTDAYYQQSWSGSEEEGLEQIATIVSHEKKRALFLADFSKTCRKGLSF